MDKDIEMNNEESRSGAAACLNALRIMEEIAEHPSGMLYEHYWSDQEVAISTLLNAAKVDSDFMRGFLSTLAEYFHDTNSTGTPIVSMWRPESTMSEEEIKISRAIEVAKANAPI